MTLDSDSALDNLTRMVQVIVRDRHLAQWFSSLARMSSIERRNAIYAMSEQMRADAKDEDLIATFRLLADARVFEAACLAFRASVHTQWHSADS